MSKVMLHKTLESFSLWETALDNLQQALPNQIISNLYINTGQHHKDGKGKGAKLEKENDSNETKQTKPPHNKNIIKLSQERYERRERKQKVRTF